MEKNIDTSIYLNLSKEGINSTKKIAEKAAEESFGKDDKNATDTLLYEDVCWHLDEIYFDKETESIMMNGEFSSLGKKLGYMSNEVHISSELLIEIIEHYMKKLGKLKTVMEAIK